MEEKSFWVQMVASSLTAKNWKSTMDLARWMRLLSFKKDDVPSSRIEGSVITLSSD